MLVEDRTRLMIRDARKLTEDQRKEIGGRLARGLGRWVRWADKRKAAKIGVGLGVATVGVTTTVLTGGATAVVAGVAAGGYLISQAFAVGVQQHYSHQCAGPEWLEKYQSGKKMSVHRLDGKAHQCVRRCYVHWRKAVTHLGEWRKAVEDLERHVTSGNAVCAEAVRAVCTGCYFSHHLSKARLYLLPAVFLSQRLADVFDDLLTWSDGSGLNNRIWLEDKVKGFLGNTQDQPCSGSCCYHDGVNGPFKKLSTRTSSLLAFNASGMKADVDSWKMKLSAAEDNLLQSRNSQPVSSLFSSGSASSDRKHSLFLDAIDHYEDPSVNHKLRHWGSNWWARRTSSEKVSFGVGQTVGVVATVGAGTLDGLADGLSTVAEYGVEAAFFVGETGGGELLDAGFEVVFDDEGEGNGSITADHSVSSTSVPSKGQLAVLSKEQQETLRRVAVHLTEADVARKRVNSLTWDLHRGGDLTSCDEAATLLSYFAKVEHHLIRARKDFESVVTQIEALGTSISSFTTIEGRRWEQVDALAQSVISHSHSECKGVCYGPRAGNPYRAAIPLS